MKLRVMRCPAGADPPAEAGKGHQRAPKLCRFACYLTPLMPGKPGPAELDTNLAIDPRLPLQLLSLHEKFHQKDSFQLQLEK